MHAHEIVKDLETRRGAMEQVLSNFIPHYKELGEFIQPRRGRYTRGEENQGGKKHNSIINSEATWSLQVARSGMHAGTMSSARPWFELATPDKDLMEFQPVKVWLSQVAGKIRQIFNDSNFYNMSPLLLGELLLFGTGCMTHVDDFEDVARFYTHTAGSYLIAQNERFQVDTLCRHHVTQTVRQMIRKFKPENCSVFVNNAWDRGNYEVTVPVVHFISPNAEFKKDSKLSKDKRFKSIYYEPGSTGADQDKLLSVKGFEEFPAYCPRWDVTEEDVYGTDCPAMTALGDIKGLQIEEKRKAQGLDKMVSPPLQGPPSLRKTTTSSLPGGLTTFQGDDKTHKLSSIYDVNLSLGEIRLDINAVEKRISRAFFVDMFLAMSNIEGIQPRNEMDITLRNEERLLMLGPVLGRLHGEFLDKLIERTFKQGMRAGIFPPPPKELEGISLKVNYISTLAMAQRAVSTGAIERYANFGSGLAKGGWTGALDKFDADQAMDEFGIAIGVAPSVVRSDDAVAERRQAEQEAQAKAEAMETMDALTNAAKTASEADMSGNNALTKLEREAGQ